MPSRRRSSSKSADRGVHRAVRPGRWEGKKEKRQKLLRCVHGERYVVYLSVPGLLKHICLPQACEVDGSVLDFLISCNIFNVKVFDLTGSVMSVATCTLSETALDVTL